MGRSKIVNILILVVIVGAVLVFGIVFGNWQGSKKARMEAERTLEPLVDIAFPKPPAEIKNMSGVVKGIYGGMIDLEINDPEDYLPHPDGSPRAKQRKFVYVSSETQIFLVNPNRLDSAGAPVRSVLKFSDLKIGNAISVTTEQNIRNTEKVDATEISLVRY